MPPGGSASGSYASRLVASHHHAHFVRLAIVGDGELAVHRRAVHGDAADAAFDAARVLEKYLPYDPNDAPLHAALAEALLDGNETKRALEEARIAINLDRIAPPPRKLTDSRALAAPAEAAAEAGQADLARDLAQRALDLDTPVSLYAPRKLTDRQRTALVKLL